MKKQAGFTLIELIMVIVILGVLSAVALPKFVDLGSDARTSAMKAVEGSMRSANAIIYAKAAVGNSMGATGTLTISGATVHTVYGFAKAAADLVSVMDLSGDFDSVTTNVIKHKGATTPANCSITYAPAVDANTPPTYTQDLTAC